MLNRQLQNVTGSPVAVLGKQKRIYERLRRLRQKCPSIADSMGVPSVEDLNRIIEQIRRQLADLKG